MNHLKKFFFNVQIQCGLLIIIALGTMIVGCGKSAQALPSERADAVVERFYEYISEAKIKGGSIPLREAYKLISSKKSRLSKAKFVQIASKYPPGFRIEIVSVEVEGRQASVKIAYKMQSMFDEYTVNTVIPLSVDKTTNTWKIDFTGELDGQEQLVANKGKQ